jgi:ribonuclease Z
VRELVVLGTASQVPTRHRNHNGYLLRWDGEGFLFDPGEGTQRQLTLAGLAVADVTRICLTHFHGDHCLGLPGVIQRFDVDEIRRPVYVSFPASGQEYFDRLRHACAFHDEVDVRAVPVASDGVVFAEGFGTLTAYRRMLPELLQRYGVHGPEIGRLRRDGVVQVDGATVTLEQVSQPRRGQRIAFVMDTRLCPGAFTLAQEADLLIVESTYLEPEAELARAYGHLTAGQAARLAAGAGARRLVLTHFSRRYPDAAAFGDEAAAHFSGEIVVAEDLMRVAVPPRD